METVPIDRPGCWENLEISSGEFGCISGECGYRDDRKKIVNCGGRREYVICGYEWRPRGVVA